MTTPRDEWRLETRRIGRRVLVFDCLESTNTYAAAMAADTANDGLVILADAQSAGRGQHGRQWQSPPGTGVLLSALVFPPPDLRRPVVLAAWAAVAVCETVSQVAGLEARVKWPNDVLIGDRKVCGILIEQGRGTVVGIGLNVNQSADLFAAAGLPQAESLANAVGHEFDCREVSRVLIQSLDAEYDRLCRGDWSLLEISWKRRTGLIGRLVAVECHDAVRYGRLLDLSWAGLELRCADGHTVCLRPEAVRHISVGPENTDDEPPA